MKYGNKFCYYNKNSYVCRVVVELYEIFIGNYCLASRRYVCFLFI